MIDRRHEVDKRGSPVWRRGACAAAVILVAAQIAAGAPRIVINAAEEARAETLPGMADTVIREDMGVDDLLDGIGDSDSDAAALNSIDDPAVLEPPAAPAPLPAIDEKADDPLPALPPLTVADLPPLMLEKSVLQADLSVVPGVTLNKIKTMSLSSFAAGAAPVAASAPILPPAAPLSMTPRIPPPVEAALPLPDPFPVRNVPPVRRHIVDESHSAPARVQSTPRPSAPAVTVVASRGGTHRVARGETLADVAALYYRDRTRWVDVYEANRDMIDKGSLEPGQILAIP